MIFDIDPVFANSEEWYQAIPEEIRPPKDQPFYHLLAENAESSYVAYVSQQNLLPDDAATSRSTIRRSPACSRLRRRPLPAPAANAGTERSAATQQAGPAVLVDSAAATLPL